MEKAELIRNITEAYEALDRLLATMPPSLMTASPPVYDRLTVKDVIAHVEAWERLCIGWLQWSYRGRRVVLYAPGYEGPWEVVGDRLNEHIYQQRKNMSLSLVLNNFRLTHADMVAMVERMSDYDLNDPSRFDWTKGRPVWQSIAGNSYEHMREHLQNIEAWLKARVV